jgi:hypothetical protein
MAAILNYRGEEVGLENGRDALNMLGRLASDVTGMLGDMGRMSKDIEITVARVDQQMATLQGLTQRLGIAPGAAGGLGGLAPLAIIAGFGLQSGGNGISPTPNVPPIVPPPPPPNPQGNPSPHRNTATPPTIAAVNVNVAGQLIVGGSCDRTHIVKFGMGGNAAPGTSLITVNFGGGGYAVAPQIIIQDLSTTPGQFLPTSVSQGGYVLSNNAVLQAGFSYEVDVLVVPRQENFD